MLIDILKLIVLLPYLIFKSAQDKKDKGIHLYGIYGYFGLPGKGKTMAMCKRLSDLRKKSK